MVYVPNCQDPQVQAWIKEGLLPSNLCDYPYETLVKICERQPSLCQPYPGAAQPSIWEPIIDTVEDVGSRILRTTEAVGTGALGTLDLATVLAKMLPLVLIGGAIYFITRR